MRYPVDRTSEDGLQTTIWKFEPYQEFYGDTICLRLETYQTGTRKTRRHGWIWKTTFFRTNPRSSTIAAKDVPLPDDVKAEAILLFFDSVTIGA